MSDAVAKNKNPRGLHIGMDASTDEQTRRPGLHKQSASASAGYFNYDGSAQSPSRPVAMSPGSRGRNFSRPSTFYSTHQPGDSISSLSNDPHILTHPLSPPGSPRAASPFSVSRDMPPPPQPTAFRSDTNLNSRAFSIRKVQDSGFSESPMADSIPSFPGAPGGHSNWSSFVPRSASATEITQQLSQTSLPGSSVGRPPSPLKLSADELEPRSRTKICSKCGLPIAGQFVRALDSAYHIHCFTCADCGEQCSSKFFPIENPDPSNGQGPQIPLCERCYFTRLGLTCYVCHEALRGSYITALGRKYHVQHFTCSMCDVVFGPEDNYYENSNNIYCHFHYSTLYASRCEGCKTAILKQFVEIYRGGREQQWHPECYMIFKFWNVKLCPDGSEVTLNPLRPLSMSARPPYENLTHEQVAVHEQEVESSVYRIWTVLCGYEEATAAFISDMLQMASSGKSQKSLVAAASLISKIEILFGALTAQQVLLAPILKEQGPFDQDAEDSAESRSGAPRFIKLGKEPKNLCKKVVEFMSIISKARERNVKRMGITQSLLNLVTSLAHYLKVLIRYGLSTALLYDRTYSGNAVNSFLDMIETHQDSKSVLKNLGVRATTSDRCGTCNANVEDACVRLGDRLWHLTCLNCSNCSRSLSEDIASCRWLTKEKAVVCSNCAPEGTTGGFQYVPKLQQFVFLLKIAVARLQLVLGVYEERDRRPKSGAEDDTEENRESLAAISSETLQNEKGYMTTLSDIRRLRSAKLDRRVSEMSRKARQSRIMTMPDSEVGQVKNDSTHSLQLDTNEPNTQENLDVDADPGTSSQSLPEGQLNVNRVRESPHKLGGELEKTPTKQSTPDRNLLQSARRTFSVKRKKELRIEELRSKDSSHRLDRTTDLLKNEKSLTLDDIPRIVAAEQAREQRPNAFRHQQRTATGPLPVAKSIADSRPVASKKYISELTSTELFYVQHISVLLIHNLVSQWFSTDELFDLIETRKPQSLWGKFGKAFGGGGGGANSQQKNKKKVVGVFGTPLDQLVQRHGIDSTLGVGPSPLRIPAFVEDCISSMRQKDMSIEGVFRKNGNIRRLKEFSEKIDKNPEQSGLLSEENAVQLAALLKKFLRELPEPLMTSKLQKLWITAQNLTDINDRRRLLHLTCCLVPKTHRDVMEVLFYFLNWTASFSHIDEESGSKMDSHNLATVITPNILYIKQKEGGSGGPSESGDAYFLSIESVNTLIEDQSQFAEVPPEILMTLQNTHLDEEQVELTSRDVVSRVEKYLGEIGGIPSLLSTVVEPSGDTASVHTVSGIPVANGGLELPQRPPTKRVDTDEIPTTGQPVQASIKQVDSRNGSVTAQDVDAPNSS